LYIPLGGNKNGIINRDKNILITMLLGGFWHGAGWTFIIWGFMHGILIIINHHLREIRISVPIYIKWIITFFVVIIAWGMFRSESLSSALFLYQGMIGLFGFANFSILTEKQIFLGSSLIIFAGMVALLLPNVSEIMNYSKNVIDNQKINRFGYHWDIIWTPSTKWALLLSILFITCIFFLARESPFLYYQF
jgi:hypothetical protein